MIILDFGSGETCKNNRRYIERMIDELAAVDTGKQEVIIKWQLFDTIYYQDRKLASLEHHAFYHAKRYAEKYGYKTTASVFDKKSIDFLAAFDIPFIKIANREEIYSFIHYIQQYDKKIIMSISKLALIVPGIDFMCCVSKYPAEPEEYIERFSDFLHFGLSDHTTDFFLYNKYKPRIYECHYKLEDSTGPDAGPFARTPAQLKEIL